MIKVVEQLLNKKKMERQRLFSLEKRRLREDTLGV